MLRIRWAWALSAAFRQAAAALSLVQLNRFRGRLSNVLIARTTAEARLGLMIVGLRLNLGLVRLPYNGIVLAGRVSCVVCRVLRIRSTVVLGLNIRFVATFI